jgi:H+/Cl- antiporter ClcA
MTFQLSYIVLRCKDCFSVNQVSSRSIDAPPAKNQHRDSLADFSTDRRMLLLCLLALPIGAIGAIVAKALLWLIAVITNLVFYWRWSGAPAAPEGNHLGWWVILVPIAGSLLIGLMARFGSEKIRGHGIPEALESILLGRSLIDLKVAILKPVSSAVSIGTGGPFGAEGPIIMTGGAFGSILAVTIQNRVDFQTSFPRSLCQAK